VLDLTEIAGLTQAIDSSFDASNRIESTIEANPGTVDMAWLRGARNLGFNRISLGIQTLDDELLRRLGRIHSSQEALEVLRVAQEAGFERISADLMLGISGQRTSRVMEDARVLADKGVEHLSIYMLDLDKDCPLKRDLEAGRMTLPAEDEVADAFETLQQNLPGLGLHAYEISNFARPGCEAKHNLRYWERRPYLGLGPSAASHLSRWRWSECEDIEAWSLGQVPLQMQELSSAEELAEIPLLGLRMRQGVDWDEVRKRASLSGLGPLVDSWKKALDQFCKQGLLKQDGNRYSLTSKGMLLSNEVMELFV
jgi:oxygen-independent coproporphyrinogen-3 oxidase